MKPKSEKFPITGCVNFQQVSGTKMRGKYDIEHWFLISGVTKLFQSLVFMIRVF